jgi:uncharacterized protein
MEKGKQLPKTLKLFSFAKKGVRLHGELKISDMPRVYEIAKNDSDSVKVNLSFHLENEKTPCVKGIINSTVVLDCQRCLDNLKLDLNIPLNLAFVRHENQADELDSCYEIYHIGDLEELETIELITDEILLSIPMAPSHNLECGLKIEQENKVEEHPFDVLKNIKIANFGKE